MYFSEALTEALGQIGPDVEAPYQYVRFYHPGDLFYTCIVDPSMNVHHVKLEKEGTNQEKIVEHALYSPIGANLMMDDWEFIISPNRLVWENFELVLKFKTSPKSATPVKTGLRYKFQEILHLINQLVDDIPETL